MNLDLTWEVPATRWEDVLGRYICYIQLPTWKAMTVRRSGSTIRDCTPPDEAARLAKRLQRKIDPSIGGSDPRVPAYPVEPAIEEPLRLCDPGLRDMGDGPVWLRHFWRALLLNRDGYTCHYCRRSAWGVYEESVGKRTLRLELDHRIAKAQSPEQSDFAPSNITVACRSCNVLKGQMTIERFWAELHSLTQAVVRNASPTPTP